MLDFLYSDHERVASLMAQIEGVGSLVGYERVSARSKSKGGAVKGSMPIISGEHRREDNLNRQLRQDYDPLWLNSAKLVDAVAQKQDADNEAITYGKLVTLEGELICLDQGQFNNLLKSPAVIEKIAQGLELEESNRSSKTQREEKRRLADIFREYLQSLPLGVVFILLTEKKHSGSM